MYLAITNAVYDGIKANKFESTKAESMGNQQTTISERLRVSIKTGQIWDELPFLGPEIRMQSNSVADSKKATFIISINDKVAPNNYLQLLFPHHPDPDKRTLQFTSRTDPRILNERYTARCGTKSPCLVICRADFVYILTEMPGNIYICMADITMTSPNSIKLESVPVVVVTNTHKDLESCLPIIGYEKLDRIRQWGGRDMVIHKYDITTLNTNYWKDLYSLDTYESKRVVGKMRSRQQVDRDHKEAIEPTDIDMLDPDDMF